MPNHTDSSGFVVRISLRANLDDRVVIDVVSIGGHAGPLIRFVVADRLTLIDGHARPSIRFVVADCLTAA
jgi:hypothetical protein